MTIYIMQAHLLIIGSVQGVGYRQFVKWHARKLGLTGWVKNLRDGSVEAVLQGNKELVEQLIKYCRKGPVLAAVQDIHVSWEYTAEDYSEFIVLRD